MNRHEYEYDIEDMGMEVSRTSNAVFHGLSLLTAALIQAVSRAWVDMSWPIILM